MLEIIYYAIAFIELILAIYILCSANRYSRLIRENMEDKELLIRIIDKAINQRIVMGILFTITIVLDMILGKEIWIKIINISCGIMWLSSAKRYLEISNSIKDDEE